MVDRQKLYCSYVLSHARRGVPDEVDPPLAAAAALGVQDARTDRGLRTISEVEIEVRRLEAAPDDARDDDPDVGPSARDKRELEDAQARLRTLIREGGVTDTGDRWLFDAAADEIMRLRAELQRAGAERDALGMGLSAIRATLETPAGETTQGAAGRVMREQAALMAELRQAKEALEQARAKVDELRGVVSVQNRLLNAAPPAAPGLTEDERAALERLGYVEKAGTWQHLWVGPAYEPAKPDDLAELRRDMAGHRELDKTELSAEDAATLRGAGWVETQPGHWRTPQGLTSYGEKLPAVLAMLRQCAAELRAKAPPVAHGEPGKATGGDLATGGTSSLAEEHGAAQGTSPAPGQDAAPHGGDRGQGVDGAPRPGADVAVELAGVWLAFRLNMLNRLRYPGDDSEARLERCRGNGRGWRSAMRRLCAAFGIPEPIPEGPGAEHARALLAQETRLLSLSTWQLTEAPPALPKPPRVEAGQRWAVEGRGGALVVHEVARDHGPGMYVYMSCEEDRRPWGGIRDGLMLSGPAWTFLGGPSPQDPSPKRDGEAEEEHQCGGPREACMEPGCDECGTPAAPSEPTARDAVAGMLLRRGLAATARDVAEGRVQQAAETLRGHLAGPGIDLCIAALEALTRDELRVHAGNPADLFAAVDTLTRERDEARAEAAALRDRLGGVGGELSELRREHQADRGGEPTDRAHRWAKRRDRARAELDHDDLTAFARGYLHGVGDTWGSAEVDVIRERRAAPAPEAPPLQPAEDVALDVARAGAESPARSVLHVTAQAEEPSGMRIEKRADGEYIIGNTHCVNNCMETREGFVCHYHINGEHIRTAMVSVGGAERILARWPIAAPACEDEPAMSGGTSHPEALTSADGRVTLIIRDGVEALDVLATVTELLGLPAEDPNGPLIPCGPGGHDARTPEQIDAAAGEFDSTMPARASRVRAYARGIREGERRAKAKAAELATSWEEGRLKSLRLMRDQSEGGQQFMLGGINSAALHALQIRKAFGVEPTDPGKPPTGEPVPDASGVVPEGGTTDLAASAIERARADGIAEGLTCAYYLIKRSCDLSVGQLDAIDECLEREIAKAAANVVPSDGQPTPAAPDRETLGREVHGVWRASWKSPLTWEDCTDEEHAVDCAIGERLFAMGARWATGADDPELAELARLIDDDNLATARALLEKVAARRGEADTRVVAARWELAVAERRDPDADLLASHELEKRTASTTEAPAQGPTLDALRELVAQWERDADREANIADSAPSGSLDRARHNAVDRTLCNCARDLCRVAGIEPPPCPPFPPVGPQGTPGPGAQDGSAGGLAPVEREAAAKMLAWSAKIGPMASGARAESQGFALRDGDGSPEHIASMRSVIRGLKDQLEQRLREIAALQSKLRKARADSASPARPEMRNGELTCPCGDALVESSWPWPPGGECLYCCTCLSRFELGSLRELRGPDDPPRGGVKPPHNAGQGALGEAAGCPKADVEAPARDALAELQQKFHAEHRRLMTHVPGAATRQNVVVGQRWRRKATDETWRVESVRCDSVKMSCGAMLDIFTRTALDDPRLWELANEAPPAAPSPLPAAPSTAPAAVTSPRIEVRGDTWLIGDADPGCGAESGPRGPERRISLVCTAHLDGEHLATVGRCEGDPGRLVAHRWPIAPVSPETPDPRWEPGATWEHRGDVVRRLELRQIDGVRGIAHLRVHGTWSATQSVPRADMNEINGWRYVGNE